MVDDLIAGSFMRYRVRPVTLRSDAAPACGAEKLGVSPSPTASFAPSVPFLACLSAVLMVTEMVKLQLADTSELHLNSIASLARLAVCGSRKHPVPTSCARPDEATSRTFEPVGRAIFASITTIIARNQIHFDSNSEKSSGRSLEQSCEANMDGKKPTQMRQCTC